MNPRIVVSAVCVFDDAGRLLTVRKRGTDKFMHPGGKPEAGETAAEAAARELEEEVGIVLAPDRLDLLGCWLADAANEAATKIEATVFTAPGVRLECPAVRRNRRDPLARPRRGAARGPCTAADGPCAAGAVSRPGSTPALVLRLSTPA
jgi:8-oxo-dGTP pyrophosphatase MutT (NUDIX family)